MALHLASRRRARLFRAVRRSGQHSQTLGQVVGRVHDHGGSVLQAGKHFHVSAKIAADLDFLPMDPVILRQRCDLRAFGLENEGVCGNDDRSVAVAECEFHVRIHVRRRARHRHLGFAVRY